MASSGDGFGRGVEWPTLFVIGICYGGWLAAAHFHQELGWLGFAILAAPLVAWHSSLQHEALHGHPTAYPLLNEILVFAPLNPFIPYRRYRSTHLAHHDDRHLTDPEADPESFYIAPERWAQMSKPLQLVYRLNNSLAGRLILGPPIMVLRFSLSEARLIAAGRRDVIEAWCLHFIGLVPVFWLVSVAAGLYFALYCLLAVYPSMSLIMIRTYAEHQAEREPSHRTVIVEGAPFLSLLFLNNSLHAVHHRYPGLPWYRIPAAYRAERDKFLSDNGNYLYRGYGEIFRSHLFRAKEDPVHPILAADERQ